MKKIFYQSNEEYHKDKRLSKTALDKLNRSPAHYQAWLNEEDEDPTPAMVFGAFYHAMALEPDTMSEKYALIPEDAPDKRTKAGKEWWWDFDQRFGDYTWITQEQHDTAEAMVKVLMSHSRASRIIENAMIEHSVYGTLFGIDCKVKPDILNKGFHVLADLKSAVSAEYSDFQKAISNFRYHVQASFYMDLVNMVEPGIYDQFIFIVQEKTPPYGVMVYRADDEMLRLGRLAYTYNLDTYKECQKMKEWPCYPEPIVEISLPAWAK